MSTFESLGVCAGFMQATGWPCVVAVMANWYGKGKRGAIMGEPTGMTCSMHLVWKLCLSRWSALNGLRFVAGWGTVKPEMRPTPAAASDVLGYLAVAAEALGGLTPVLAAHSQVLSVYQRHTIDQAACLF